MTLQNNNAFENYVIIVAVDFACTELNIKRGTERWVMKHVYTACPN